MRRRPAPRSEAPACDELSSATAQPPLGPARPPNHLKKGSQEPTSPGAALEPPASAALRGDPPFGQRSCSCPKYGELAPNRRYQRGDDGTSTGGDGRHMLSLPFEPMTGGRPLGPRGAAEGPPGRSSSSRREAPPSPHGGRTTSRGLDGPFSTGSSSRQHRRRRTERRSDSFRAETHPEVSTFPRARATLTARYATVSLARTGRRRDRFVLTPPKTANTASVYRVGVLVACRALSKGWDARASCSRLRPK